MNDPLDLSYAAGLIDGEGTITLSRRHTSEHRSPVVSIPSCTSALLVWLKSRFGGCVSGKRRSKKHHSPSGVWTLVGDAALMFVDLIFPYMHEPEKIRRARLLIDEYKSVTPRNGRYSADGLWRKRDFEKRFFRNTRRRLVLAL